MDFIPEVEPCEFMTVVELTPGNDNTQVVMTMDAHECAALGIKHVWMHRGPGPGSVSAAATDYGRAHGIAVIDGGCPCMFGPTADSGHKAMRALLTAAGNVPRRV